MTRQDVEAWLKAAIADGWSAKPTWHNEPLEQAANLKKDGWEAKTISRPPAKWRKRDMVSITVWAPDGLQVVATTPYSWDALISSQSTCQNCLAENIETTRYGFAGRVCLECREVLKEPDGWTS